MELLFSYGEPVAVSREKRGATGSARIYHVEPVKSQTTRAHIEKFANGRTAEPTPLHSFRIMYLVDLALHLEAGLFKAMEVDRETGEGRTH